jgi:hypothetical protein
MIMFVFEVGTLSMLATRVQNHAALVCAGRASISAGARRARRARKLPSLCLLVDGASLQLGKTRPKLDLVLVSAAHEPELAHTRVTTRSAKQHAT